MLGVSLWKQKKHSEFPVALPYLFFYPTLDFPRQTLIGKWSYFTLCTLFSYVKPQTNFNS